MATSTTRLGLRKPDPNPTTGDFVDVTQDLNNNWDNIDGKMPFYVCTSGTRPGSPYSGMQIFETDTGNCLYWNGTASAWRQIMVIGQGTRWADPLASTRANATDLVLAGRVTGDTQDRVTLRADGRIDIGPGGSTAVDTNIYRSGQDRLATDDRLDQRPMQIILRQTTATAAASGATTVVTYNTTTANFWSISQSSGAVTIPTGWGGSWTCRLNVTFALVAAPTGFRQLNIRKGGTQLEEIRVLPNTVANQPTSLCLVVDDVFAAGDVIDATLFHTQGASVNYTARFSLTYNGRVV